MIEETLRRQLRPVVKRRKHLYLAHRLAICWLAVGLLGLGLVGVNWLWGWQSPLAAGVLCLAGVVGTMAAIYRSRRLEPDYHAVARNIERHHPELRALLLAAVEQKPEEPGGRLGYLRCRSSRKLFRMRRITIGSRASPGRGWCWPT